jgi:hypothetical protein
MSIFSKNFQVLLGAKVELRLDFRKMKLLVQNKGQAWGFQKVLGER